MTLLKKWENKKSWSKTYPICPIYRSITNGKHDFDLRSLLNQEKHLTLDINSLSGFSEIEVVRHAHKHWELNRYVEIPDTIEDICFDLLRIIYKYFEELWDANTPHVMFCSGGIDSRILVLVLKKLQDNGKDLGDLLFINHEPEHIIFNKAMKEMGWKKEIYMVWKEDKLTEPDYYEYGDISRNMNCFYGPTIMFSDIDESKTCFVSGNFGGELLDYTSCPKMHIYHNTKTINLGLLNHFAKSPAIPFLEIYWKFKDVLMPYLSYEYLNYVFKIPRQFFVQKKSNLAEATKPIFEYVDDIRMGMLNLLGNKTEFFRGHSYNLKFTKDYREGFNKQYKNSKLYKDFEYLREVREALPGDRIEGKTYIDSKLWGLATVYEEVDVKPYDVLLKIHEEYRDIIEKQKRERMEWLRHNEEKELQDRFKEQKEFRIKYINQQR